MKVCDGSATRMKTPHYGLLQCKHGPDHEGGMGPDKIQVENRYVIRTCACTMVPHVPVGSKRIFPTTMGSRP